jgi:hypothetical protein
MIGFVGGLGAWASHSLIDFWLQKHLSPHDHHYPAYVHASLSLPDFSLNARFNETLLASLRKTVVHDAPSHCHEKLISRTDLIFKRLFLGEIV